MLVRVSTPYLYLLSVLVRVSTPYLYLLSVLVRVSTPYLYLLSVLVRVSTPYLYLLSVLVRVSTPYLYLLSVLVRVSTPYLYLLSVLVRVSTPYLYLLSVLVAFANSFRSACTFCWRLADIGFCRFVEFESAEDCAAALDNMNESEIYGRTIRCNIAKPMKMSERYVVCKLAPHLNLWVISCIGCRSIRF